MCLLGLTCVLVYMYISIWPSLRPCLAETHPRMCPWINKSVFAGWLFPSLSTFSCVGITEAINAASSIYQKPLILSDWLTTNRNGTQLSSAVSVFINTHTRACAREIISEVLRVSSLENAQRMRRSGGITLRPTNPGWREVWWRPLGCLQGGVTKTSPFHGAG